MKRHSFFLSDPQKASLDKTAKELGISSSELLRRIVDRYTLEGEIHNVISKNERTKNRRNETKLP